MGQEHRIGYVRPYYDADVVLWNKNPLAIGAHPLKVWIDGYSTFQHTDFAKHVQRDVFHSPSQVTAPVQGPTITPSLSSLVTYHNIKHIISNETSIPVSAKSKIVVQDDIIVCMGPDCEDRGDSVDLHNGWVVPGIIAANVHLGLEEISQEDDTSAGYLENASPKDYIQSEFGIQIGLKYSKMLRAAFKAGVTTSISSLRFSGAVGAVGVAFRTGVTDFDDNPILASDVGQNFKLGNDAKSKGPSSSVAGQMKLIQESGHDLKIVDVDSNSYIRTLLQIPNSEPRNFRRR